MNTSTELRAAAANCRRLAQGMARDDDSRKLLTLAAEFDELAHAVEAAESPERAQRNG